MGSFAICSPGFCSVVLQVWGGQRAAAIMHLPAAVAYLTPFGVGIRLLALLNVAAGGLLVLGRPHCDPLGNGFFKGEAELSAFCEGAQAGSNKETKAIYLI